MNWIYFTKMDINVCLTVMTSWHLAYGQRLLVFYENVIFDYDGPTFNGDIRNDYRFSSKNKTSFIRYHDDTLEHCQDIWRNLSFNSLQKDYDGIISLTKSQNLLSKQLSSSNEVLDILYQFESTFSRLKWMLSNDRQYYSCVWLSPLFISTVSAIFNILRTKNLAVLIEDNYCSNFLMRDIQTSLLMLNGNKTKTIFNPIYVGLAPHQEARNRDQFYDLLVEGQTDFLMLLQRDLHKHVFKMAAFFSLLGPHQRWLIPNFDQNEPLGFGNVLPGQILSFQLKTNDNFGVTKLSDVVGWISETFQHFRNDQSLIHKSSILYSTLMRRMYHSNIQYRQSPLEIFYYNGENQGEWQSNQGFMRDNKLTFYGDVLNILRSSETNSLTDRIRIVTINDAPYTFVDGKFYDADNDMCSDGFLCQIPIQTDSSGQLNYQKSCCIGFIPDIFRMVIKNVAIPFEMYVVADGKYGGFKNGTWNGMIADVAYGKADMAMAAITITKERSDSVSFSAPFMFDQTGIITKPAVVELDFLNWEFLAPLSKELQIYLVILVVVCMLLLYFFENTIYFYIYHHHGFSHKAYYSFLEGLSHISGVTLQRDLGGKHPLCPAARIMCLFFAIGMVIIVSTYTAVLAAQSLKSKEREPLQGGSQDVRFRNPTNEFRFGILRDSSYESFFKNGETDLLKRMSVFMEPYNYDTLAEGMDMVRNGTLQASFSDFAFLHFYLSKDRSCQLKLVKDKLYSFGLGFPMAKDFPYRELINQGILKFTSKDMIAELQAKWFDNICQPNFFVTSNTQLSIKFFGGLVFILAMTIIGALLFLYPEHLWWKYFHEKVLKLMKRKILKSELKSPVT
ncbi:glutamate receptor ionotropic, NMDA 3B-like [Clytia hemisphaerica]